MIMQAHLSYLAQKGHLLNHFFFFFFCWIQTNSLDTEDVYFKTDCRGRGEIKGTLSWIKEISLQFQLCSRVVYKWS